MFAFALNKIRRANGESVAPKSVFTCSGPEFEDLRRLGAARTLTSAERAEVTPKKETATERKAREAEEAARAEAEAAREAEGGALDVETIE